MNFNIAIDNNVFKPYDYLGTSLGLIDRYNKGYAANQEVYDKISLTLGTLASAVEGSLRAKELYDSYNADFAKAAESFANGMTTVNSRDLAKLRSRYGSEILRLELARLAMAKVADVRRLMSASGKGDDYLYEDIGNLDNYLSNPNYVPRLYNGKLITLDVATAVKAASADLFNIRKGADVDKFYQTYLRQSGFRLEDVAKAALAILRGEVPTGILGHIASTIVGASGILQWLPLDARTLLRLRDYIAEGMYLGVGSTTGEIKENLQAKYDEELAKALAIANAKEETKRTTDNTPGETVPMHFTNAETAGYSMKTKMALATLNTIKNWAKHPNTPAGKEANKIIDYWKKKDTSKDKRLWETMAMEHWVTKGFNGNWLKNDKGDWGNLYYRIGETIRNNITKNESLINTWRSGFINDDSQEKGFIDTVKNIFTESPISPNIKLEDVSLEGIGKYFVDPYYGAAKQKVSPKPMKNWGDFDKNSINAYTFNAVRMAPDETQKKNFLNRILSDANVRLYEIKGLDASTGNILTKGSPNREGIPVDSDGYIDSSKINMYRVKNGYILYWSKMDGDEMTTVQRFLPALDIGQEELVNFEQKPVQALLEGKERLDNMLAEGKITPEDYMQYFQHLERIVEEQSVQRSYGSLGVAGNEEVKVNK